MVADTEEFGVPEDLLDTADLAIEEPTDAPPEYEVATLMPTGGTRVYLPIGRDEDGHLLEPSIMQAALDADLSIPPNTQFWVDGVQVDPSTTILTPGMIISAIGNVKGGK